MFVVLEGQLLAATGGQIDVWHLQSERVFGVELSNDVLHLAVSLPRCGGYGVGGRHGRHGRHGLRKGGHVPEEERTR